MATRDGPREHLVSATSRTSNASVVKAAIIQARPVPFETDASLDKLADLVADAARAGATVVTAGETFLPGYPAWIDSCPGAAIWDDPAAKEVFAAYRRESIVIGSPREQRLAAIARENKVTLVVGVSERVDVGPGNGTLYNALLTYTPAGELAVHHRKLVPTYTEKLIWGPGDGHGLESAAFEGGRVGGLICWEHWMPLARHAMHEASESVHVAVWPTVHDRHVVASRSYAFEARCFVLAAGQIQAAGDLPASLARIESLADDAALVNRGGSCIINPRGEIISEQVWDAEAIIHAECDLSMIDGERMTLDVTGHYARPDVLRLQVDRDRR